MSRTSACFPVILTICLFSTTSAAEEKARTPKFSGTFPGEYLRTSTHRVRSGREILFRISTIHVPGYETRVECGPLPRGAQFQPSTREFRWTPTLDQRGTHVFECVLINADEFALDRRTLRFEVGDNRPPELEVASPQEHRPGHLVSFHPLISDPDGDPVTCSVRGLPQDAKVTDEKLCHVEWRTTEDAPIKTEVVFSASDGQVTTTKTVRIHLKEEWESYLLPGAYYSLYRPVDATTYGTFHGTSLELVVAAWVHRNDNHGPSHGRASLKVDLLSSTREGQPVAFFYAVGLDLSLERNPLRRYLIPFFGLDVGGMTQRTMGHHFQATPRVGLHLWTNRNLFISLSGGYMFVPGEIESLRGWRGSLGGNLTLW